MEQIVKAPNLWLVFAFLFVFVANVNSQNTEKKMKKNEEISIERLNIGTLNLMSVREGERIEAQGDAGMTTMDYNKAMENYLKLVEAIPGSEKFQLKMAIACDSAGEINEAIKYYQNTIKINSNNYQALLGMGKIYLNHLDEIEEAVYLFESALKSAPETEKYPLIELIAQTYDQNNNMDEARDYYTQLVSDSKGIEGLIALGKFEFRQGNYPQAIKQFEQAKNKDPKQGVSYCQIGLTYEAMGELEKARANYEWAVENLEEKNFDGLPYYYSKYLLKHSSDDSFMVSMYLLTELNQKKPHPDAWCLFASFSYDNQDYTTLIETLEPMAGKYGKLADYNYFMGMSFFKLGNKKQAKTYLSIAAEKGHEKAKKILDENNL